MTYNPYKNYSLYSNYPPLNNNIGCYESVAADVLMY